MEITQNEILSRIAGALDRIAGGMGGAPAIQKPLAEFPAFDWGSINARVLATDSDGVAVVDWGGKPYKRRSPDNKYGAIIRFSRCIGKADDGANQYEVLIDFREINDEVEPIGQKAKAALSRARSNSGRLPAAAPTHVPADSLPDLSRRPEPEDELDNQAQVFAEHVTRVEGGYRVVVNAKTSHMVSKPGIARACTCEQFAAGVRCAHIRAVGIWFNAQRRAGTTRPAQPQSAK